LTAIKKQAMVPGSGFRVPGSGFATYLVLLALYFILPNSINPLQTQTQTQIQKQTCPTPAEAKLFIATWSLFIEKNCQLPTAYYLQSGDLPK
jgi:hypothetical protein